MKQPKFTEEQKDWICYQIGEWYLHIKDNICDYDNRCHRLGRAKELLKMILCEPRHEIVEAVFNIARSLNKLEE